MASPEFLPLSKLTRHSKQATSRQSAESASCPFFEVLPLEIRRKIYRYAFEGSIMHIGGFDADHVVCASCGLACPPSTKICCDKRLTLSQSHGPDAHNVLLTCYSMYYEARSILAASVEVCFDYFSGPILTGLSKLIHKHTFLEHAAPHVKHVSAHYRLCEFSTIISKIFTGIQLISFEHPGSWELYPIFVEDGEYNAKHHTKLIGHMAGLSASALDQPLEATKNDLHIHFHYQESVCGSEYRLVYDLTSDIIVAEHIELKNPVIGLSEDEIVFGQKLHRQLLSAAQEGAMKDGREQGIGLCRDAEHENLSAWVKIVKTADFCDELLW